MKFTSWVKDDRLVLDANKDYWGGKIDVDQIIFRPLPELAARIAALVKGEVDLITKIPPDQMDRVAKASNTKIEGVLYGGLYCLSVVSQKPPLDSKPFRQAMSLAIDRETIVKELWRGQGAVPNSMVVKGDNHYDPSLPPLKYDPNRAKQLIKEANYKGEELVIETGVGFTVLDREMGEVIVAMWKDVGINAKLELHRVLGLPAEDPREELQGPPLDRSHLRLQRPGWDDVASPGSGRTQRLLVPKSPLR